MVVYFGSYLTFHFQSKRAYIALYQLTTLVSSLFSYYFNQMDLRGQSGQLDFITFQRVNSHPILKKEKVESRPEIQRNFDSFSTDESGLNLSQENKHFLNTGNTY
jgi:hypothetical protein